MRSIAGNEAASAAKMIKLKNLTRRPGHLYPDTDHVDQLKREKRGPWMRSELHQFEESLVAPTTQGVRRSHLKTVTGILRYEYPDQYNCGQAPTKILEHAAQSQEAVLRVGATLAERGISSAGNYFSSWSSVTAFAPRAEHLRIRLQRRVGLKFGRKCRGQAADFELNKVLQHPDFLQCLPLKTGSPIYPRQTVGISTLLMMKGITARSLRRGQVKTYTIDASSVIELRIGFRKGRDHNKDTRRLPLVCSCPHVCPHCLLKGFMLLRDARVGSIPTGYLFCNLSAGPISKENW